MTLASLATSLESHLKGFAAEVEQDLSTAAGRKAALAKAQAALAEFGPLLTELDPGAASALAALTAGLNTVSKVNAGISALQGA